ncbi:MAG: hypothetical protein ACT4PY_07930 [Armatimonadota bacterium]
MIAAGRRARVYPVWLPDRTAPAPVPVRRRRRSPIAGVMVVAVFLTLPALFYVAQRAHRAETGYTILRLQRDVAQLRADNARLLSLAATLKSPQRIEHYATHELGMTPPRLPRLAAITIRPAIAHVEVPAERRGALSVIGAWLGRNEAEASEPVR